MMQMWYNISNVVLGWMFTMQVDFAIKGGDTLPVLETLLTDSTGAPIDLTGASAILFQMALDGATELTVAADAIIIGDATNGTVQYAWAPGDTAIPGSYNACFTVAYPTGNQTFPSDDFISILVQPTLITPPVSTGPAWVQLSDVAQVTGRTDIDGRSLALAWSVIEGIIGRPLYELLVSLGENYDIIGVDTPQNVDVLTTRDQYWLKCATAWEAAWVTDNPDTFSAFDVSTINQSGQSATLLVDGLLVAPMARRCLRWVTWQKTRSVKIQRPFPFARLINPTVNDDLGRPWNRF
jgi:BppU N-terminal domain